MQSPTSPMVAKLFMKEFEIKAINSAIHPPRLCLRYVDDTFVIQKAKHRSQFMQHINSIDPHSQFAQEISDIEGSIPCDGHFSFTRTRQHLAHYSQQGAYPHRPVVQWDSQHNLSAKCSSLKTHTYRASTVCTTLQLILKEEEHIRKALTRCKYPTWVLNSLKAKK